MEKWEPKLGEYYWYISSKGDIRSQIYKEKWKQKKRIAWGNCFRTIGECVEVFDRIKILFTKKNL